MDNTSRIQTQDQQNTMNDITKRQLLPQFSVYDNKQNNSQSLIFNFNEVSNPYAQYDFQDMSQIQHTQQPLNSPGLKPQYGTSQHLLPTTAFQNTTNNNLYPAQIQEDIEYIPPFQLNQDDNNKKNNFSISLLPNQLQQSQNQNPQQQNQNQNVQQNRKISINSKHPFAFSEISPVRKRNSKNPNIELKRKRLSLLKTSQFALIKGTNQQKNKVQESQRSPERLRNKYEIFRNNKFLFDKLKIMSQKYRQKRFNTTILKFFNDKTLFWKNINARSTNHDYQNSTFLDRIAVLQPGGNVKLAWDLIHFITVVCLFIWIPLYFAFDKNLQIGGQGTILFGLIVFLIDALMFMNTAIYDKGIMVTDRMQIMTHYLDNRFFKDVFTNLPLVYNVIYEQQFNGWVQNIDLGSDLEGVELYSYAFYFATVTMCSVGYGDITPQNQLELVLCTVFMLLICITFAYFISKMGQILKQIEKQNNKKDEIMSQVTMYFKKRKINQEIQYDMKEYIHYYYKNDLDDQRQVEQTILGILSDPLRKKLLNEKYKVVFQSSNIFSQNFSQNTLNKMLPLIQSVRCNPQQIIFQKGVKEKYIYFIAEGEVEIFLQGNQNKSSKSNKNKQYTVAVLSSGQDFGAGSFFFDGLTQYSAKSKDFTTLYRIDKRQFVDLIQEYPEEYEKFCMIRDSLKISKNFRVIGKKCNCCFNADHHTIDCPYVTLQINKHQIIYQVNKPPNQKRTEHNRTKKQKYRTLKQLQNAVDQNTEFILNNSAEFEDLSWLVDEDDFNSSYYGDESDEDILPQQQFLLQQQQQQQQSVNNSPQAHAFQISQQLTNLQILQQQLQHQQHQIQQQTATNSNTNNNQENKPRRTSIFNLIQDKKYNNHMDTQTTQRKTFKLTINQVDNSPTFKSAKERQNQFKEQDKENQSQQQSDSIEDDASAQFIKKQVRKINSKYQSQDSMNIEEKNMVFVRKRTQSQLGRKSLFAENSEGTSNRQKSFSQILNVDLHENLKQSQLLDKNHENNIKDDSDLEDNEDQLDDNQSTSKISALSLGNNKNNNNMDNSKNSQKKNSLDDNIKDSQQDTDKTLNKQQQKQNKNQNLNNNNSQDIRNKSILREIKNLTKPNNQDSSQEINNTKEIARVNSQEKHVSSQRQSLINSQLLNSSVNKSRNISNETNKEKPILRKSQTQLPALPGLKTIQEGHPMIVFRKKKLPTIVQQKSQSSSSDSSSSDSSDSSSQSKQQKNNKRRNNKIRKLRGSNDNQLGVITQETNNNNANNNLLQIHNSNGQRKSTNKSKRGPRKSKTIAIKDLRSQLRSCNQSNSRSRDKKKSRDNIDQNDLNNTNQNNSKNQISEFQQNQQQQIMNQRAMSILTNKIEFFNRLSCLNTNNNNNINGIQSNPNLNNLKDHDSSIISPTIQLKQFQQQFQEDIWDEKSFMRGNFDLKKNFTYYYPRFNFSKIIEKIKKQQERLEKLKRQCEREQSPYIRWYKSKSPKKIPYDTQSISNYTASHKTKNKILPININS